MWFSCSHYILFPLVIRFIKVIDIEPPLAPKLGDHFIKKSGLSSIAEDMPGGSDLPLWSLFPFPFISSNYCTNPSTPVLQSC